MATEEANAASAWLFQALGTRSTNPLTLEMARVRAHLQENLEKCERELVAMEKEWRRPDIVEGSSPRDAKRFLSDGWRRNNMNPLSLTNVTSPSFCLRPQLASTLREKVAQDVLPPYLVVARANAVLAAECRKEEGQVAITTAEEEEEAAAAAEAAAAETESTLTIDEGCPPIDGVVVASNDIPVVEETTGRRRRATTASSPGVQTRSARLRLEEEEMPTRKRRPKAVKKEGPRTRKTRRTKEGTDDGSPAPTKRTTRSSTRSNLN